MQIRLITDAKLAEEAGIAVMDIDVQDETYRTVSEDAEVYHISAIGADALVYTVINKSGIGLGPAVWEDPNPGIDQCVNAVFSYKGIEYTYFGDVSKDTMKGFLETLR